MMQARKYSRRNQFYQLSLFIVLLLRGSSSAISHLPLFWLRMRFISLPLSCLNSSNASFLGGGVTARWVGDWPEGDWGLSCPSSPPCLSVWPTPPWKADFALSLSFPLPRLFTFLVPSRVDTFGFTPGAETPTPKPWPSTSPTNTLTSSRRVRALPPAAANETVLMKHIVETGGSVAE